jgi:hypothetical protein
MKKYFVSYSHNGGFGNSEISGDIDIDSIKDIRKLQNHIAEHFGAEGIIILFYKELENATQTN